MRGITPGPAAAALLIALLAVPAPVAAEAAPATRLATFLYFSRPEQYKHLVCTYYDKGRMHQCALTVTGSEAKEGLPCYCGTSPKGRIISVPLTVAPR